MNGMAKGFDGVAASKNHAEHDTGRFVSIVGPSGCDPLSLIRSPASSHQAPAHRIFFGTAQGINTGSYVQQDALLP
jgi:ABC-type nitrate/sulfonate/bicarbonate transport system ATPase subunit